MTKLAPLKTKQKTIEPDDVHRVDVCPVSVYQCIWFIYCLAGVCVWVIILTVKVIDLHSHNSSTVSEIQTDRGSAYEL